MHPLAWKYDGAEGVVDRKLATSPKDPREHRKRKHWKANNEHAVYYYGATQAWASKHNRIRYDACQFNSMA